MTDPRDAAIDLMAKSLHILLRRVSPRDLGLAFEQEVQPLAEQFPDDGWDRVEGFIDMAYGGYVSEIRRLALEPEYLAEMLALGEDEE